MTAKTMRGAACRVWFAALLLLQWSGAHLLCLEAGWRASAGVPICSTTAPGHAAPETPGDEGHAASPLCPMCLVMAAIEPPAPPSPGEATYVMAVAPLPPPADVPPPTARAPPLQPRAPPLSV
jgi:hypothetical protein